MPTPEMTSPGPDSNLSLWMAADLQDHLMVASNDLERLQRLLDHASETLSGHFYHASGCITHALRVLAELPQSDDNALHEATQDMAGAITALQFHDMATQLINHTHRRLRNCADRIAAEHLEIALDDPEPLAARVRNAGALFLGHHTPEAIGDYVGGSNHVLPTARSARYSSGLSTLDFVKRTSILQLDAEGLRALGPAAMLLAEAEGLDAHGRSVSIRLNL